jgi:hypothetical protein
MDMSKPVMDWDDEEIKLAMTAFVNWHNARYSSQAVCKFNRNDLSLWLVEIYRSPQMDSNVTTRYGNHLILKWMGLKLVRPDGRDFIAMVGTVTDDEYWIICGEKVDKLTLLTVLKKYRGHAPFSFEHIKVEKSDTFEGAMRIAGFSVEDISSVMPMNDRRVPRGRRDVEADRERARDRDVG